MAEPASLPIPAQRTDPIPWPDTASAEAEPDTGYARRVAATAQDTAEQVRERTQRSWELTQRTFRRVVSDANDKIGYLRRERPLYVIAGVAAAAFVLGVALRLWRSHDE